MQVQTLTSTLAERYEAFLLGRPESLFYQSWGYQKLLIELLGCRQETLIVLDDRNEVVGALPLLAMDGPYGTVFNSLPFYGSNGSLIGEHPEAREALTVSYNNIVAHPGTASATIVENPLAPIDERDFIHQYVDIRVGQLTGLSRGTDTSADMMKLYHQKTRNMVRKAGKVGVTVEIENDAFPFLLEVHQENMNEIGGLSKSSTFFDSIPLHFNPNDDYRIYVARLNSVPIAAILIFYYNETAEYFTPVVRKDYRDTQALSATIFKAMTDAADQGFRWWNWGGTWLSQDGVYRFKSRWGTQDMHYRYLTAVRNSDLLQADRAELLAAYPNFFTVPFAALARA